MTHFNMYLFTRLDILNNLLWGLFILGVCVGVFFVFIDETPEISDETSLDSKKITKLDILLVAWVVFPFLLLAAVPTQKEAAAIWLVPKIVNNEQLNSVAADTFDIIEVKTREYLLELIGEKK